jgi:hypothetical protein
VHRHCYPAPGVLLACVVEQDVADLIPDRMRPEEPDRIQALNLDDVQTAAALESRSHSR